MSSYHDSNTTNRLVVPEAEEILGKEYKCLDKGFVRLVDYMGGDASIVQAARVSYGKGTKKASEDRHLIRYMLRNRHTSPFEMVELKFHCKMPIFVARQWIRHRTANVNEYSGRYSVMPEEYYLPELEDVKTQSKTNKQGTSDFVLPPEIAQNFLDNLEADAKHLFKQYNHVIDKKVARELARIGLPLSIYTEWYWKNDLHNTLHFLKLRLDKHAQSQIRVYAEKMAEMVKAVAPVAWEAFEDYIFNNMNLSALEQKSLNMILKGEPQEVALDGLSKREKKEFFPKLEILLKGTVDTEELHEKYFGK